MVPPYALVPSITGTPSCAAAPIVVAMGERKLAERIKKLARDAGVPMVENKPVARALLKAREGDAVRFQSPAGPRELEIVEIRYL